MDKAEIAHLRSVFTSLKIPCSFGFAGELYVDLTELERVANLPLNIKNKYFTLNHKDGKAFNRTSAYYLDHLYSIIQLIAEAQKDYTRIFEMEIEDRIKRYILFTLTEYQMISAAKAMNAFYANDQDCYYEDFKKLLSELVQRLICIGFSSQSPIATCIPLTPYLQYALTNHEITTRSYAEMDNKMILFLDFLMFEKELKQFDLVVSPLFGGVLIPFGYCGLDYFFETAEIKRQCEFVSFSMYDNKQSSDNKNELNKKIKLFSEKYPKDAKILVVDDNVGSGNTLQNLKAEMGRYFCNITTKAVEYHWEKKLLRKNVSSSEVFQLHTIDVLSPLMYRHYSNLENYLKIMIQNEEYCSSQFFPETIDVFLSDCNLKAAFTRENKDKLEYFMKKVELLKFIRRFYKYHFRSEGVCSDYATT